MTTAAAWYPDPYGEASWRWWDGRAWSGSVGPARQAPELTPLVDVVGSSLMLEQQQGSGTDVLRCEDAVVGLMHKSYAGDVSAEASSGAWYFDRQGIVSGRARVLVEPARQEIGMFAWDGIGTGTDGTLHFVDGRWFRLTRARQLAHEQVVSPADYDPSHAVWVWYGPERAPLITVRLSAQKPRTKTVFGMEVEYTTYGTGKTSADVWTDLHPAAGSVRELPLLVLLGTFLIWWTTTMRESVRRRGRFR